MLNPNYDVRKITAVITNITMNHRSFYMASLIFYFTSVIYLGMLIPMLSILNMVYDNYDENDKLMELHCLEKNYITAGFSLFLVVVMYGLRSLITYTASLITVAENEQLPLVARVKSKTNHFLEPTRDNILPSLLRVKRSVSYETFIFTKELRDHLKIIIKSAELTSNGSTLSTILQTKSISNMI